PPGTGLLGISERSAHEDVIIVDPALDRPVGHEARLTGGEIVDVRAEPVLVYVSNECDLRAVGRPFLERVIAVESSEDASSRSVAFREDQPDVWLQPRVEGDPSTIGRQLGSASVRHDTPRLSGREIEREGGIVRDRWIKGREDD